MTGPGRPPTLVQDGRRLLRHGVEHRILSGSVHYFRVHPDLWADRLRRVRAMGLNTVDTYVPWNWHEAERGRPVFDGDRDLERFLRLVGDLGMDAVVRPGPYICAEWSNGGLPAWLTGTPGVRLRTSDPVYLDAVASWFDEVVPRVAALQANRGGPVVAVQVENEYGSYGDDHAYVAWVHDALVARGIDELLFTADGPTHLMLDGGTLPGVLTTATFGSRPEQALKMLRERRDEPFVCAEFWNGWFDHWGERHHVRDPHDAARDVERLLDLGGSVSLYMAHGGTNFGLTAGANHDGADLQPTVTSYDSDAPVAEDGTPTAKFRALRDVFVRHPSPHLPADALDERWTQPAPRLAPRRLTPATTRPALPVLRTLGSARTAPGPLTFEELGQDAGLVLYRAHPVLPPGESTVSVIGLHDRATVYVDGELVGTLERRTAEQGVRVRGDGREVVLELLVENLGRVNYGPRLGEHKGILGDVLVDRRIVHTWESRSLPLDLLAVGDLRGDGPDGDPGTADGDGSGTAGGGASGVGLPSAPDDRLGSGDVAARGSGAAADTVATFVLDVEEPADTFVALPGWTKGFVWVNDVLLGRYWRRGPQRTLYVPAPLLQAGENTLTVLEQHAPGAHVELRDAPDLGEREEYVEVL
ncbi:beta-galactosidase [Cellulosimicrobium cellulans J34]|nr:beta-galactosidase [Cellulosimicrobium cellulans J34]SMF18323.1 beta-galactosidase [Cellulosimicrobium cellulans J1]